jgi:hypothetical protein
VWTGHSLRSEPHTSRSNGGATSEVSLPTPHVLYSELRELRQFLVRHSSILSNQTWQVPVVGATSTVVTVASSVVETTLATITLPLNTLNVPGKLLRLRAWGTISTADPSPGSIRLRIYLGSSVIVDSLTKPLTTGGLVNSGWSLDLDSVVKTLGASGTHEAQGRVAIATSPGVVDFHSMSNTSPQTASTTGSVIVKLTVQFSVSDPLYSISCRSMVVQTGGVL